MIYHASSFIFDGISSDTFGLYLMELNGSGSGTGSGGISMEIMTDKTYRSPIMNLYGTTYNKPLEFTMSFGSNEPIDSYARGVIQKWLFGHQSYKKLQIIQDDMQDVYFNCVLNNPKIKTVGNKVHLFECTVVCDAPWAWEEEQEAYYSFGAGAETTTFTNNSDSNDFLKPVYEIKVRNNGDIKLTNETILEKSHANAIMEFKGLTKDEIITVDARLEMIKSSTGIRRMENFNKSFLYLLPYDNILKAENIATLKIKYKNARKVGA